jgi:hypothetical protein
MFTGIDKMGPIWSMVPCKDSKAGVRLLKKVVTTPYVINVFAIDGFHKVNIMPL